MVCGFCGGVGRLCCDALLIWRNCTLRFAEVPSKAEAMRFRSSDPFVLAVDPLDNLDFARMIIRDAHRNGLAVAFEYFDRGELPSDY